MEGYQVFGVSGMGRKSAIGGEGKKGWVIWEKGQSFFRKKLESRGNPPNEG